MEIEFWWLLALPLFFALGWLAARIDIRQVVQESRALPRSYLNGLNFLLNEQPDKAIDAFVEAVRIDPQTVELHFALGSLFRRRGETDRAIRIHQLLVDREDLDEEQRLQALSELVERGELAPVIDRTYPLADAPEALRYLEAGHPRGKVVVAPVADARGADGPGAVAAADEGR